jgi:hypothetical protein
VVVLELRGRQGVGVEEGGEAEVLVGAHPCGNGPGLASAYSCGQLLPLTGPSQVNPSFCPYTLSYNIPSQSP